MDEKAQIYEAIDYHGDAEEGVLAYPRRFVKFLVRFQLEGFVIRVRDEEVEEGEVVALQLAAVELVMRQRPAANHFHLAVTMEALTVTGIHAARAAAPTLVSTVRREGGRANNHLLSFSFETNPPEDPLGDLDQDPGSLYDRALALSTSPLEVTWHTRTLLALRRVFHPPQEVRLGYLQESTIDSIRDYKDVKMSQLGWQFVIDHHVFFKVNIELESSYFIFPKGGEYSAGCPCLIANLGRVVVANKAVTREMVDTKREEGKEAAINKLKSSILDQAYDKFSIRLENMEVVAAHLGEDWRAEMADPTSKLFVLRPINVEVNFRICLIPNDPEYPVYRLSGALPGGISVCIEQGRLLAMAEIAQDILDPDDSLKQGLEPRLARTDSNSSFASAVSSVGTQGSQFIGRKQVSGAALNVPQLARKKERQVMSEVTKLELDFSIARVDLEIEEEQQVLFRFQLEELAARATVKQQDVQAWFEVGGCLCEQASFHLPSGAPVPLLSTRGRATAGGERLLAVHLARLGEKSPAWRGVHQAVTATLSSVALCLHQDAILHLAKEAALWTAKVRSRASKLMGPAAAGPDGYQSPGMARLARPPLARRQVSRQSSLGEEGRPLSSSLLRQPRVRALRRNAAGLPRVKEEKEEHKELVLTAIFKGVTAELMTKELEVGTVRVEDLATTVEVTASKTRVTAKLREVRVEDRSKDTLYSTIVESRGQEVFNVTVEMYEGLTRWLVVRSLTCHL